MKAILAKLDALMERHRFNTTSMVPSDVHAELFQIREALEQHADFETAYRQWDTKTQWVQDTAKVEELGMHRADVLRQRIETLQRRLDALSNRAPLL